MRTLFLAVGLSALLLAPMAQAEELTIRIPVMESDVATPQAVAALYQRVEYAAGSVCTRTMPSPLTLMSNRAACRREVVANAIANAGIPELTAYHREAAAPVVSETATLASR